VFLAHAGRAAKRAVISDLGFTKRATIGSGGARRSSGLFIVHVAEDKPRQGRARSPRRRLSSLAALLLSLPADRAKPPFQGLARAMC
jgi:hypothetical protein